jgi:hypothetical protein
MDLTSLLYHLFSCLSNNVRVSDSKVLFSLKFQDDNPWEKSSKVQLFSLKTIIHCQDSQYYIAKLLRELAVGFRNSHNSEFKHMNLDNLRKCYRCMCVYMYVGMRSLHRIRVLE